MKALIKYFKKRKANIVTLLEKPRSEYSADTFHELRVEIKKLNALFHLVEGCTKDFHRKKIFKPFKLIFSQAGKIRELQLEEAMLKKHFPRSSLVNYKNDIKQQGLNEQDEFFRMVNDKLPDHLEESFHKIVPFLEKINGKDVNHYLAEKENVIKEIVGKGNLQTEQAHKLRKLLKMLNYNRKSCSSGKAKPEVLKTDILSEMVGKWHDYRVMSSHLEKAIAAGTINPDEVHELEMIKAKINSAGENIFKRINADKLVLAYFILIFAIWTGFHD